MGLRFLGSAVAALPAEIMARIAAAEQMAQDARTDSADARAEAKAADGRAEAARVEAAQAVTLGEQAHTALATTTTTAEQAAALANEVNVKRGEYEAALLSSVNDRAAIHSQLGTMTTSVAANTAAIDRLTAALGKPDAIGSRGIAALLLGGQAAVTVQLSRPMPNLNYRIEMTHSAVVTLAAGMLVETGRTTSTVTVRVTAVGLALAAGTLHVAAREG